MAATKHRTAAFTAKLLAPLPASEEPVDTPAFRRAIKRDMLQAWQAGMERVHLAKAERVVAWAAFEKSGERYITDGTPSARIVQATLAECHKAALAQALIPSPTMTQLRWKRKNIGYRSDLPSEVAAVIEADAARLTVTAGR